MCWWRSCASGWDWRPACTSFYRFSASRSSRKRPFYAPFMASKRIPILPKTPTNSLSSTFNRTAVTANDHPFQILDKYRIDYVLLSPQRPLTYLLEHTGSWRPIYTAKVATLLEQIG